MLQGLLTKKLGMTKICLDSNEVVPITLLQVIRCVIVGKKTLENDGYEASVLAYGLAKDKSLKKSHKGILKKANVSGLKHLCEVKGYTNVAVGEEVSIDNLEAGILVDASGTSVGKGFSGVMKRHNFGGMCASHGVSIAHRSQGSTGGCQDPGKVFKNKKMAGQLGNKKVTVQNLKVVQIDKERNILFIKGAVPGAKNSLVKIKSAVKQAVHYNVKN
ncbi:50S ribosomal protein L3 [Candidatus Sneabacter namystus]|uniref:Large ribosomal subunit protein uL3 n=1 Tax=Candidatus Sneabacter namystus TaxID=2601646 RepID=A0A5C0UJ00_9RICK|nr:50S ribosomal protein L3 [Candidatus Sneabacter namystus]QEK39767.1 50S ribosomal protein L3 [Candidatus Sneabacter namystus]